MSQHEVTWAGFGGQGIMVAGQLLAYTGISEGKNVVWIPSYGPEMRGGTAYCTVVVSSERIGSPIIKSPSSACVFNRPSFDKFSPTIKPGGILLVNSSLIEVQTDRTNITELLVPANEIAMKCGHAKSANVVMLGAFVGLSKVVELENVRATIVEKLGKKKDLLQINMEALDAGFALAKNKTVKAGKA